ncbi:MAG: VCBS repeat-containing protein, partial [Acidobacteria bacterium]|nr:VCBS repeat-containing protein [Acidobacteriota bacterium]
FDHALFRNRRDGAFEDVTSKSGIGKNQAYGMGAAVADYNNDGYDDLFITNFNGPNLLYRNNRDGTFSDVTKQAGLGGDGRWSSSASFLDYNKDGHLDLFVVRYVDFTFQNNKICGPFEDKGLRAYCTPQVYDGLSELLYRNNGDGTFSDVTEASGIAKHKGKGLGVTVLDYNRDDWPDVYVANDSAANFLFRNNRDGSFTEVALEAGVALDENGQPQAGMGTTSGDFDGNGFPDLFVTNLDFEYLNVYRNLRNGIFEDASAQTGVQLPSRPFVGFGVGLADFDNDSDLDLLVANGHILDNVSQIRQGATYRQRKLMFENVAGTFREVGATSGPAMATPQVSRGLALGDYDNDGWIDVLVSNLRGFSIIVAQQWRRRFMAQSEIDWQAFESEWNRRSH